MSCKQFEFSLPWQGGFVYCLLAVLCLSFSLPHFNLLHHFTTTTGLKEKKRQLQNLAQNLLVMKTAFAEDKAGKSPQGQPTEAQESQEYSRECGKNSIIIINIRAKSHTLVNSMPCLKAQHCHVLHFSNNSPRIKVKSQKLTIPINLIIYSLSRNLFS